jgi:hypothetical protein
LPTGRDRTPGSLLGVRLVRHAERNLRVLRG